MDHREIVNYILMGTNAVGMLALVWIAARADRRAASWEARCWAMVREKKRDAAPTVVAPAWHAPRSDTMIERR